MRGILRRGSQFGRPPRSPCRIDWQNPLALDLYDCIWWGQAAGGNATFNAGSGADNLSRVGGFAIPNGSSPNCQFTTGSLGGAGQSDAAGLWQTNPFIQGNYGSNLADGVTFRCLFMPTSAFGGTYTTLFGDGNNLRTLFNGSQQLQAVAMAATFHDSILLGNFTVNAVHDFVITNATSGLTTYYQNGTALGSNTIALMNNIAITVSFFAGDNTRMVGIVFLFQVWKRLLSAAEIAYLYTDPFAMIVPVEPEMMIMNPPPAVLYAYTLMGQIVF